MDFTRIRLEPLNGVLFSPAAEESSSFADDSQESSSSSSSPSRYEQEEDEDETSTLPSGNSQEKLDLRRREIKGELADSQPRQFIAAADEIKNTNIIISYSSSPPPLPPIEIFTVPTRSSRNKKNQKKKYNDNDDSSPSSTSYSHSTSTASGNGDDEDDDDDDSSTISCLSSNASPIFQACRERIRVERANWADFYSALFQRHLDQSARVIQKHVRGMMQRRQYNLLRKKLLCYDVYNTQVATARLPAGQDDQDDDLLQCIGSFEHVYVAFNNIESNNTNDEAASTTLQGNGDKQEDHDDDHDDENSVTHFSITKWLAANHESRLDDKCQSGNVRDDDDDNTASTSVEVTDSSTDCDFLGTIGNNNVHSAIAFAAPPPRDSEECYFIPCIDDHYALPVQKANQHNMLNGWFFQHS